MYQTSIHASPPPYLGLSAVVCYPDMWPGRFVPLWAGLCLPKYIFSDRPKGSTRYFYTASCNAYPERCSISPEQSPQLCGAVRRTAGGGVYVSSVTYFIPALAMWAYQKPLFPHCTSWGWSVVLGLFIDTNESKNGNYFHFLAKTWEHDKRFGDK